MRPLDSIIARHEFFKDFKPEHLALFQACAEEARFNRGQYLLRQGQGAERFFLIRRGLVRIELVSEEGKPIRIQTLGPDEAVGWSWVVSPHRWSFDARALEPTIAIVFDGAALRRRLDNDFEFGYRLLQRVNEALCRRLEGARLQLLRLHTKWELED